MALTDKQKALLNSCPILKELKDELISALGGEEESSEEETVETPVKRSISVTVTDGSDPVNTASVVLTKSSETIASSTTGSSGGCTLQNVEDGTYTLTVTKEGFTDYTASVTTSEDNTSLSVTLTATSSQEPSTP